MSIVDFQQDSGRLICLVRTAATSMRVTSLVRYLYI